MRLMFALLLALMPSSAGADDGASPASPERGQQSTDGTSTDSTSAASLFATARQAMESGRAGDAIAILEALADRGVVDAAVSFDRGLAYAGRVRMGSEQPGDLGRAAQGFEEARELTSDPALARDATQALTLVRAEVARRRARAGDPVELEQGTALGRTIVQLLPEDAWAIVAMAGSVALGIALFVRAAATSRRRRVGSTLVCALAAIMLGAGGTLATGARHDRLHLREGVIVSATARPADERGLVLRNQTALPEATRVEVMDSRPGWTMVRWGPLEAWVPSPAVRSIARPD